jgi:hypothetical protein
MNDDDDDNGDNNLAKKIEFINTLKGKDLIESLDKLEPNIFMSILKQINHENLKDLNEELIDLLWQRGFVKLDNNTGLKEFQGIIQVLRNEHTGGNRKNLGVSGKKKKTRKFKKKKRNTIRNK